MSSPLHGNVCVVAGMGGSMGRGTALAFARDGALVVVRDRLGRGEGVVPRGG
jgi:NAD(P)-dependent dehydrogenase (short-subunit alcohol dehydrogenase family)